MIETLHSLAASHGINTITLTLNDTGMGNTQLVMQCLLHPPKENQTEGEKAAREALKKPIIIEGFVGEVDAHFSRLIERYVGEALPLSNTLTSNMDDAIENVEQTPLQPSDDDSQEQVSLSNNDVPSNSDSL